VKPAHITASKRFLLKIKMEDYIPMRVIKNKKRCTRFSTVFFSFSSSARLLRSMGGEIVSCSRANLNTNKVEILDNNKESEDEDVHLTALNSL
jgi:hypothetical protein